jgi:PAS domain-containing protein
VDWRDFTVPEHLSRRGGDRIGRGSEVDGDPYEKDYRRRDGSHLPVHIVPAQLPGEPGRVVVAIEDTSATRVAEHELRQSEQRLQPAKQATGIGVWDWDLATNSITWPPELYAVLGINPSIPPDRPYRASAEILHPADLESADLMAQRAAGEGLRS